MVTKEKLRNQILNKVKRLPDEELTNLEAYLNDLETKNAPTKPTLSYSGIFKELEIGELTSGLNKNRTDNHERIPSF
jgi:hypothetical protein